MVNGFKEPTIAQGYVMLYMPEHPRCSKYGRIKRAIVVLEEKLGRPIKDGFDCHHENEIKDDDRDENLSEVEHGKHKAIHNRNRKGEGQWE